MNEEIEDLSTDDELTREDAFTQGIKKVSKFNLRPMTATTFSWVQRTGLFEAGFGDAILIAAAYAYLHCEDVAKIRASVNNRDRFISAVDEWMDANVKHHSELEPVTEEMNASIEQYMAAITQASNQSDQGKSGPKN